MAVQGCEYSRYIQESQENRQGNTDIRSNTEMLETMCPHIFTSLSVYIFHCNITIQIIAQKMSISIWKNQRALNN